MEDAPFIKEIQGGLLNDISTIVPYNKQTQFLQRLKGKYRKSNSNINECAYLGWRSFKAARSLLFSAILYVESIELFNRKFHDSLISYGLYYSLFHASYSLLCLNPTIIRENLSHMKHSLLFKLIKSQYVTTKLLPENYLKHLEKLRIARELTSYFIPIGGLKKSNLSELSDLKKMINETKLYLKYAFQLSYIMDQVQWDIKSFCLLENMEMCKKQIDTDDSIFDEIEERIRYPEFKYAEYELSDIEYSFDDMDALLAVRKFGLFKVCPVTTIYELVNDHMIEEIFDDIGNFESKLNSFLGEVW